MCGEPGGPGHRVPGVWAGHRGLRASTGRRPPVQGTRWFSLRGSPGGRGREPGRACSWPCSPHFPLMLFFAGKSLLRIQLVRGPEQLGAVRLALRRMQAPGLSGPRWEGAGQVETQRLQGESLALPAALLRPPRTAVPPVPCPGPGKSTDPGRGPQVEGRGLG